MNSNTRIIEANQNQTIKGISCPPDFKTFLHGFLNTETATVSIAHYSRDGNREYLYPKQITVNGREYWWAIGQRRTKGRSMSSHHELWLHGGMLGDRRICTLGNFGLKPSHLRQFFKAVYQAEQAPTHMKSI